jgi:GntR family transcriptional repressor for pyruvate dehydrogenase complex
MRRTQGNLTERVTASLSEKIDRGTYAVGEKLPTEQFLCDEFGVSRTVIREAIASLRSNGRLISRQGVGVFVQSPAPSNESDGPIRVADIHTAMQVLEFRLAIEPVSAALAAQRRTAEGMSGLLHAFDRLKAIDVQNLTAAAHADWDFHIAVGRVTENSCFVDSMERYRDSILFDIEIKHRHRENKDWAGHFSMVSDDHGAILAAISLGEPEAAREAMTRHLTRSLMRYRGIVESSARDSAGKMMVTDS